MIFFDPKKLFSCQLSDFDIDNIIEFNDFGIEKINNLSSANESKSEYDLCFLHFSIVSVDKYINMIENLKSKYVIVSVEIYEKFKHLEKTFLISENPKISFFKILNALKSEVYDFNQQDCFNNSNSSNFSDISKFVKIGDVKVGSFTSIADGCVIEDGSVIGSSCVIEKNVKIGKNCTIENNVSISNCVIGDGCIIKSGAVIGGFGFGFEFDKKRNEYFSIPHIGIVEIGKNCTIGSCTVIDRGTIFNTKLGNNVKLDSQVMIGHNVEIGDFTCIAGQSGVAGSTKIGKFCMIGGKVAINGHIKIGNNVKVVGSSNIASNVSDNEELMGAWISKNANEWMRFITRLNLMLKRK